MRKLLAEGITAVILGARRGLSQSRNCNFEQANFKPDTDVLADPWSKGCPNLIISLKQSVKMIPSTIRVTPTIGQMS